MLARLIFRTLENKGFPRGVAPSFMEIWRDGLGSMFIVPSQNATLLQAYVDAELKILRGQSVRMGERYLQYADLAEVRRERARLQAAVDREAAMARGGGSRWAQADFNGYSGGGCDWNRC